MNLGVMVKLRDMAALDAALARVKAMGFGLCQLSGGKPELFTADHAARIRELTARHGIRVSALGCSWGGAREWDLVRGPLTIGLVPPAYRAEGIRALKQGADFACEIGVPNVICHAGFIPNNPNDPDYGGVVCALREVARHFRERDRWFLFETGTETPVTLLRTIEDIESDRVGINLDPANLIMYGMGNPIDALDVVGRFVRHVHGKDGLCPTSGRKLGREMPLGRGKVNVPAFIAGLKAIGYDGPIIIEREIAGPQQEADILAAKRLLESLIG